MVQLSRQELLEQMVFLKWNKMLAYNLNNLVVPKNYFAKKIRKASFTAYPSLLLPISSLFNFLDLKRKR